MSLDDPASSLFTRIETPSDISLGLVRIKVGVLLDERHLLAWQLVLASD